jgi:carbon monoxide dehydrogenase subunit G
MGWRSSMTFTQSCTITASREVVWDFLMDMQNIAQCLPGVEDVRQVDTETYDGTLRIKMGPIALALQGTISVEVKDRPQWHGAMRAEAKDRKLGGGVRARFGMDLLDRGAAETELRVTLEAHVLGKIGEFGQPLMRKRADAMLQDFAHCVSQRLSGAGS